MGLNTYLRLFLAPVSDQIVACHFVVSSDSYRSRTHRRWKVYLRCNNQHITTLQSLTLYHFLRLARATSKLSSYHFLLVSKWLFISALYQGLMLLLARTASKLASYHFFLASA